MTPDLVVAATELRHNRLNEVTKAIHEVRLSDGRALVRKQVGRSSGDGPERWRASEEPDHWNFWRREVEAYESLELRTSLAHTGLAMPGAQIDDQGDAVTLWLQRVEGTAGPAFGIADHEALMTGLGRWQARPPEHRRWWSRRFLRRYSGSKPFPSGWSDHPGWSEAIVREWWPPGLRTGWQRLVANRDRLIDISERLPRTLGHLDVWPANAIRAETGEVVLLDWAFAGDAAVGEDPGNHIPDSMFDLFWPRARLDELEELGMAAYVAGLRDGGWTGAADVARLGILSSAAKYAWLLPQMVVRARNPRAEAYFATVDVGELYAARGAVFDMLVRWADEALELAGRLGG